MIGRREGPQRPSHRNNRRKPARRFPYFLSLLTVITGFRTEKIFVENLPRKVDVRPFVRG